MDCLCGQQQMFLYFSYQAKQLERYQCDRCGKQYEVQNKQITEIPTTAQHMSAWERLRQAKGL